MAYSSEEQRKRIIENYDSIIDDFHDIVNTEMLAMSATEKGDNVIPETVQFNIDCNSFGLLSSEVCTKINELYSSNETYRRIWGTISTNFGFNLSKYGISTREFSGFIIRYLNIAEEQVKSYTMPELAAGRMGLAAYNHLSLQHPNDFWVICIFLLKLTIHKSLFFQTHVNETIKLHAARNVPIPPKKKGIPV